MNEEVRYDGQIDTSSIDNLPEEAWIIGGPPIESDAHRRRTVMLDDDNHVLAFSSRESAENVLAFLSIGCEDDMTDVYVEHVTHEQLKFLVDFNLTGTEVTI